MNCEAISALNSGLNSIICARRVSVHESGKTSTA